MKVSPSTLRTQILTALRKAVITGSGNALNNAMLESLSAIDVTGNTFQMFNPIMDISSDKMTNLTIASINSKAPELLERGTDSPYFPKSPYPVYIPDWVSAKGLKDKFKSGWVRVGNPETTHWGSQKNKWFTNMQRPAKDYLERDIKKELIKIN